MDELLATVRNWFKGLAQREQYAVLAGAAASVALLLFAAWMPVERRVSHLEDNVRTKQADLAWLQTVAPQLDVLRNAASSSGGQSLVVLVDGVARQTGIARSVAGSSPGDDGTLSVRLEQVSFDALITWAGELVQHHGVRVVSANIDGGAAVGSVSATFVLRGP
jgi:type II secretory pathway component PulM